MLDHMSCLHLLGFNFSKASSLTRDGKLHCVDWPLGFNSDTLQLLGLLQELLLIQLLLMSCMPISFTTAGCQASSCSLDSSVLRSLVL